MKPTGRSAPDPMVKKVQKVWAEILRTSHMASYGCGQSSGDESSEGGSDSETEVEGTGAERAETAEAVAENVGATSIEPSQPGVGDGPTEGPTAAIGAVVSTSADAGVGEIRASPNSGEMTKKRKKRMTDDDSTDDEAYKDNKSKNARISPRAGGAVAIARVADAMENEVRVKQMFLQHQMELDKMKAQNQQFALQMQA